MLRRIVPFALVVASVVAVPWAAPNRASAGEASFIVNSAEDTSDANPGDGECDDGAGSCTLRAALEELNTGSVGSPPTIQFDIVPPGPHTIQPRNGLPSIVESVTIDGRSQPGFEPGRPAITLDGSLVPDGFGGLEGIGLRLQAGAVAVLGLGIQRFPSAGIFADPGTEVRIQGNLIGTDALGTPGLGNRTGITVGGNDGLVGGVGPALRNVVSGNQTIGIHIFGLDNVVQGNLVGTGPDGTSAVGNGTFGIFFNGSRNVVGGTAPGEGNVVAFNALAGISVLGSVTQNALRGNDVHSNGGLGIDLAPFSGVSENDDGDLDTGPNQLQNFPVLSGVSRAVAATVVEGSLSSTPSTAFQIDLFGSPDCDPTGNGEGARYLGSGTVTTPAGGQAPFTFTVPEPIDAGDFVTATATDPAGNTSELSDCLVAQTFATTFTVDSTADGPDADTSDGTCADSLGQCTLRAAIQQANSSPGMDRISFDIEPAGPHTIQPATALPQISTPLTLDGTTQPGFQPSNRRPVITLDGDRVDSRGLALAGRGVVARGLAINRFRDSNVAHGILVTGPGAVIEGMFIGTDHTGTVALPNRGSGIALDPGFGVSIGGPTAAARNLISGNREQGILMLNGSGNRVIGNLIGVGLDQAAMGNGRSGITIAAGQGGNVIGGLEPGLGNVIAANTGHGVGISHVVVSNTVVGNRIGTNKAGASGLGNGQHGVFLNTASNQVIGGIDPGAGNIIINNGLDGVHVSSGTGNVIRGNSIFGHQDPATHLDLGIDLLKQVPTDPGSDGVTPNDPAPDADSGANHLQNFPTVAFAHSGDGETSVSGSLTSFSSIFGFDLDFYSSPACSDSGNGEGATYLGSTRVFTSASGFGTFVAQLPAEAPVGHFVTATATHVANPSETSEFSLCREVRSSVFRVDSKGDDPDDSLGDFVCATAEGECSIRAAIEESNKIPGENRIEFRVGEGPVTITVVPAGLPAIVDPVEIDGTTQPGFDQRNDDPIVTLDGDGTDRLVDGLTLVGGSDGSEIRGLVIVDFGGDGIDAGDLDGLVVEGSYLGVEADGSTARGNGGNGISISKARHVRLGGAASGLGNVVSSNRGNGIAVENVSDLRVEGNVVGLSAVGSLARGNRAAGIVLSDVSDSVVGAREGPRNVVSANGADGIHVFDSRDVAIERNLVGTNLGGTAVRPNADNGIHVNGSTRTVVGGILGPVTRNIVSGNGRFGVLIDRSGIGSPASVANSILGNHIGTNTAGSAARANGSGGVLVFNETAANSVIGTKVGDDTPGAGNLVSGNASTGVAVRGLGVRATTVQGNVIGLDATGTVALGNGEGVTVDSPGVLVGGETEAARNIVSGNLNHGIGILAGTASSARVKGNFVGTDATGMLDRGNGGPGIDVQATGGQIGADPLAKLGSGVGEPEGVRPGGNVVSGNGLDGLRLEMGAGGTTVLGNLVGTAADGRSPLGNGGHGIAIRAGSFVRVGDLSGLANVIAFNGADGIAMLEGSANGFIGNEIHSNAGLGIDLADDGPTPNDPQDPDLGPNGLQNFPVVTSVLALGGSTVVTGGLDSEPDVAHVVHVYASPVCDPTGFGEGDRLQATVPVPATPTGVATWSVKIGRPLPTGSVVTALALSPTESTSEFSACREVETTGGGGQAPGDFDRDGFDDLAVGVPGEDLGAEPDAGAVNVLYGSEGGVSGASDQLWTQNTPGVVDSAEDHDRFGSALAAGDFNGDGFDDLAVGVPGEDVSGQDGAGSVHLLFGSESGLTAAGDVQITQATTDVPSNPEAFDGFGSALASGKFDPGTVEDLAVGAPGEDLFGVSDAGAAYVLYGGAGGPSGTGSQEWHQDVEGIASEVEDGDAFGSALAGANFGGTAEQELAIGAPGEQVGGQDGAGAVHVLVGGAAGLSSTSSQFRHQDTAGIDEVAEPGDEFGSALAAGDFGRTRQADLAIGAPGETLPGATSAPAGGPEPQVAAGAVHVLYGAGNGLTTSGSQLWSYISPGIGRASHMGDRFGAALAAGDVGFSGQADLAIGAPGRSVFDSPSAGEVLVLMGGISGLAAVDHLVLTQETAVTGGQSDVADSFGAALAIGALNGAGFRDLAIGVPGASLVGPSPATGAVHVMYGTASGPSSFDSAELVQGQDGVANQAEPGDGYGAALG